MRAGSSSMVAQQSLTPDASAIIKQALTLARHRGHVQVTPFHVAITLLSLPNSLLRSSCFHSHSQTHPLRTRALDLCFNVALSRLPSCSSTMMLGSFRVHNKPPSLSNALMATFKRAQAHQRRGSEQQMMVNAVRIDVEQLIMSILDDPSISRVMKEAGFVSAQVKAYIEKVSPELSTREVRKNDKSLDLNLNCDSNSFSQIKRNGSHGLYDETTNEVVYSSSSDVSPSSSNRASALPPWLLHHDEERRTEISSNKVSLPNSNSSTDTSEVNYHPKFNELNAENLKILCDSLFNISCRKETVSEIASTILKCRSGINRRNSIVKEDTWLFFLGIDTATKQKIARELAAVVFGSNSNIVSVSVSNISCQSDYFENLIGAIQENPHRIFLLEDIDKVDYCTQVAILNAVASGSVNEDVGFNDAIVILSCESFDLKLRTKGRDDGASFDLNRCAENDQFDSSFDSVGLLEAVDRTIIFNCFNDL